MARLSAKIRERNRLWKVNNKERYHKWSAEYAKKYRATHQKQFKKYEKEYYAKNRDRELKANAEWYRQNKEWACLKTSKRRAVYRDGICTVHDWLEIQRTFQFKCVCCGKETKLSIDHIIPLKLGGKHSKDNIQPLCLPCNMKKKTKIIDYRGDKW